MVEEFIETIGKLIKNIWNVTQSIIKFAKLNENFINQTKHVFYTIFCFLLIIFYLKYSTLSFKYFILFYLIRYIFSNK